MNVGLSQIATTTTLLLLLLSLSLVLLLVPKDDYWTTSSNRIGYSSLVWNGEIRHVHLSVGEDASTTMTVSFSTHIILHDDDGIARMSHPPEGSVWIGRNGHDVTRVVKEQMPSKRYLVEEETTTYRSDYFHHVRLETLWPDTRYFYQCECSFLHPTRTKKTKQHASSSMWSQIWTLLFGNNGRPTPSFYDDRTTTTTTTLVSRSLFSPIFSFRTAPLFLPDSNNNNHHRSVKMAIVGDVGQTFNSQTMMHHLWKNYDDDISVILLPGDLAYTGTTPNHSLWDSWFDMMCSEDVQSKHWQQQQQQNNNSSSIQSSPRSPGLLQTIPLQVAPGNHEIERNSNDGTIFTSYEYRFAMPYIRPPIIGTLSSPYPHKRVPYPLPYDYGNAYYAFTYGLARVFMLSSYSAMHPTSLQYRWLFQELSMLNRTEVPWVVVTLHSPVYNPFLAHADDVQILMARRYLEPIFVRYNVNLVVAGHVHGYMRSFPIPVTDELSGTVAERKKRTGPYYWNDKSVSGPVYIIVGTGGKNVHASYDDNDNQSQTNDNDGMYPRWLAIIDNKSFGYGTIEFLNHTHAKWDFVGTGTSMGKDKKGTIPNYLKEEEEALLHLETKQFQDSCYIINTIQ